MRTLTWLNLRLLCARWVRERTLDTVLVVPWTCLKISTKQNLNWATKEKHSQEQSELESDDEAVVGSGRRERKGDMVQGDLQKLPMNDGSRKE